MGITKKHLRYLKSEHKLGTKRTLTISTLTGCPVCAVKVYLPFATIDRTADGQNKNTQLAKNDKIVSIGKDIVSVETLVE